MKKKKRLYRLPFHEKATVTAKEFEKIQGYNPEEELKKMEEQPVEDNERFEIDFNSLELTPEEEMLIAARHCAKNKLTIIPDDELNEIAGSPKNRWYI